MNISSIPEHEVEAIKEFRSRVQDLIPRFKNNFLRHDLNLYRWLRARNFNLDQAEEMLRKHMEWRVRTDMDTIFSRHTPEEMEDHFPLLVSGMDKAGYPVVCCHIGGWDFRKAGGPEGHQAFLMYVAKLFEQILEFCQHVTTEESYYAQFRGIFDFEGFMYSQITNKDVINVIREVISMFEDNYPELPKVIYIINAPKLFQIVWNLIKPMLSERTITKIQIHGTNRDKWQPSILEHIQPDDLPSRYGGNITSCFNYKFKFGLDAFPRFETLPEREMTSTEIPAGKKHIIEVKGKAGNVLSWNFKTEQYDIGFQVDCNDEPVIKYARIDAYVDIQKGMVVCEKSGTYSLLFDNSYSSFKSKKLKHIVRVYEDYILRPF